MKKSIILLVIVTVAVTACPYPYDDEETYTPIYMSRENLDASVNYTAGAHDMIETGKIYY